MAIHESLALLLLAAALWGWRDVVTHFPSYALAWAASLFAFGVCPVLIFVRSALYVDDKLLARTYLLGPRRSWPVEKFSHTEQVGPQVAFVGQQGVLFKVAPAYWGEERLSDFVAELTVRRDRATGRLPPTAPPSRAPTLASRAVHPARPGEAKDASSTLVLRPSLWQSVVGRCCALFGLGGVVMLAIGLAGGFQNGKQGNVVVGWILTAFSTSCPLVYLAVPRIVVEKTSVRRRTLFGESGQLILPVGGQEPPG